MQLKTIMIIELECKVVNIIISNVMIIAVLFVAITIEIFYSCDRYHRINLIKMHIMRMFIEYIDKYYVVQQMIHYC